MRWRNDDIVRAAQQPPQERNICRASGSARSSPPRSVRPTVPTISDPPENNTVGSSWSTRRNVWWSEVCPGDAIATIRKPLPLPMSIESPSSTGRCGVSSSDARGATNVAPCRTVTPGLPGHVVGVRVGVERPHDAQPIRRCQRLVRSRESRRIDQRRGAVADVDQVARSDRDPRRRAA